MDSYFIIFHLPDQPTADILVLDAADDDAALARAAELGDDWPLFARLEVFQGERRIAVIEGRRALAA